MLWRLKLSTKLEIENMCIMFWCLTASARNKGKKAQLSEVVPGVMILALLVDP
jgi:hypothetical protein